MSNQMNRVRSSGSRLFNVGGRSPKITIIVLVIAAIIALAVAGRLNPGNTDNEEKYSLNISYGLGGDENQTRLSFDANIGGDKSVVENIDAYEILIKEEYLDLLLENGPYSSKDMGNYWQITGVIVFDTAGLSKEEINAISIFEGIKIIDKDGNEDILYIPVDKKL